MDAVIDSLNYLAYKGSLYFCWLNDYLTIFIISAGILFIIPAYIYEWITPKQGALVLLLVIALTYVPDILMRMGVTILAC